ncbi:glycosyltransferase family 4 protein [Cellvibrio sp. QJXJ]|uniref:glycosyltransferase family 4 protein n=1 Tax=Cellvibrio sp. QJXJ TaxID=2964606 RepID=UPI0021C2E921|nr:glycosyltransferase family 4 protein [Cellvibrio sp. QJXJ]UUA71394.1 glycosyltransferase family 4 protein [Cellvibrio sp. QJXJ]
MKILLVARWPVGGIRTYFRYIYAQDLYANYELVLLAPDIGLQDFLAEYFPVGRIRFIKAANSDSALRRELNSILRSEKFDVIHSHGFSAGALVSSLAQRLPAPHIMTAHDVFRADQFVGIKGKVKSLLLNLAYWRLDGVLTVGQDALENFKEFIPMVSPEKIHNIDHGVDAQRFASAEPRDFHKELDLQNRNIIGFFGRFMSQKGLLDVIKAMKILLERRTSEQMPIVLTFGWGGFIREDYALIDQLGLSDYFRQLPFTDDVPAAIKGVDLVVMPSRWEACGLLAMEVLSAGTPLIASNCIGLRCVVKNTPALVIDPYRPDQLANAIEAELTNSSAESFAAFQPLAVERFALAKPARALHEYYQQLKENGCV